MIGLDQRRRRWPTNEGAQGESAEQKQLDSKVKDALVLKDKEIAELTETLKRLQAEFENYKKRNQKERAVRDKLANQELIRDLLVVLDSFDKALEDAKKNGSLTTLRAGIEGVYRQFVQILQREGLREIETDGKFDPFVHEALVGDERDDIEDGRILEVFQKGYTLGPTTIRPARVRVARKKEPETLRQKEGYEDHNRKEIDKRKDSEEDSQTTIRGDN